MLTFGRKLTKKKQDKGGESERERERATYLQDRAQFLLRFLAKFREVWAFYINMDHTKQSSDQAHSFQGQIKTHNATQY